MLPDRSPTRSHTFAIGPNSILSSSSSVLGRNNSVDGRIRQVALSHPFADRNLDDSSNAFSTYHTGVERHGRLAKPPTGIANQNDHGATSSAVLNNDYPSAEASHNTSTTPHISPIEGPSRLNVSTSNTTETQNNLAPRKLRTNGLDILLEPLSSAEKLPSLGLKRNVRDLESTSRGELWGSKETAAPGEVDEISLGTLEQNAYTGGERGSDVINDGRKVHNQMRSETGDIRALDERLKRIEDRMSTLEKKLNELVEFAGQILAMSNEHYRLSMEKYYGVSC